MNFFESQDRARKNTVLLITLFTLAVVALVIVVNLFVMLVLGWFEGSQWSSSQAFLDHMDWERFTLVGLGVCIVILAGSLYKIMSLGGGGKVVAESMGGALVQRNTTDFKQRQLLNVIEEMAIASGTPAPPVYLLENEAGINAFAAGFTPRDAVIGVTQGLIDNLGRDELQGVIAHEFSHIFNGDMRLNIQLIGILNGILVIGRIGGEIARAPFRGVSARSRSSRNSGSAMGAIMLIGLGLLIIGYLGVFFGNLIKAAVSRQREFLADASAVQFTRNPTGIAGALKRIGGLNYGSRVLSSGASDISHAFFARGVSGFLTSLWATHPPLPERIRRIEPGWNGMYISSRTRADQVSTSPKQTGTTQAVSGLASVEQAIDSIGSPDAETVELARQTINEIPETLEEAAREPWGARALVYGLLLDGDYSERVKQLEHLQYHADRGVYQLLQKLMDGIDALPARFRLPLIDLALPALKQLSNLQYQAFRDNVEKLIRMDKRINLMEWSLRRILFNHLDGFFHNLPRGAIKFNNSRELMYEISLVLSVLALAGHDKTEQNEQAFSAAVGKMALNIEKPLGRKQISLDGLDRAVSRLQQAAPNIKRDLIRACAACTLFDSKVTGREIELLRAFADTLDCPLPMMKATDD